MAQRLRCWVSRCAKLLSIAEECWTKPPYASAHAGSRSNFTNRALFTCEELQEKLREIPLLVQPEPASPRT